ncbi:MAG: hypothetical protein ACRDJE_03125 [Dehalococcoidia bacterium]
MPVNVAVPDDLAEALIPYSDRLDGRRRLGLDRLKSEEALMRSQQRKDATSKGGRRKSDRTTAARELPPLVVRLDERRVALARGRVFSDSADLIRQERDDRHVAP